MNNYLTKEESKTLFMTREEVIKELSTLSKRIYELGEKLNIYSDNRVDAITPYTDSKVAYCNESEKTFYNTPLTGNISVFFDNYSGSYSVSRIQDIVRITFDTLTESTNITISII